MRAILLLLLAAVAIAEPQPADACSCLGMKPKEYLDAAPLVFLARAGELEVSRDGSTSQRLEVLQALKDSGA